jgi:hypothetical protein
MVRKCISVCFLFFLLPSLLFASWSFVFESWDGHPQIASTLVPTSVRAGTAYDKIVLFSGWQTDLLLLGGVGYLQRSLYQNPQTGALLGSNPFIFDLLHFDWTIGLKQYFDTERRQSLFLGYRGSYEQAFDSMAAGKTISSGLVLDIPTWMATYGPDALYGPLSGVGTSIIVQYSCDRLIDTLVTSDGYSFTVSLGLGPKLLNTNASYLSLEGSAQVATTLHQVLEKKKNVYSIVLVDRLAFAASYGSFVPFSVQERTSQGSLVRGFGAYQYPRDVVLANQLELRVNGPENFTKGLFPRFLFFFDLGYGFGQLMNTNVQSSGLTASFGPALTFVLTDYLNIGYQMAYLIAGTNADHPGAKIVGEIQAHIRY